MGRGGGRRLPALAPIRRASSTNEFELWSDTHDGVVHFSVRHEAADLEWHARPIFVEDWQRTYLLIQSRDEFGDVHLLDVDDLIARERCCEPGPQDPMGGIAPDGSRRCIHAEIAVLLSEAAPLSALPGASARLMPSPLPGAVLLDGTADSFSLTAYVLRGTLHVFGTSAVTDGPGVERVTHALGTPIGQTKGACAGCAERRDIRCLHHDLAPLTGGDVVRTVRELVDRDGLRVSAVVSSSGWPVLEVGPLHLTYSGGPNERWTKTSATWPGRSLVPDDIFGVMLERSSSGGTRQCALCKTPEREATCDEVWLTHRIEEALGIAPVPARSRAPRKGG